MRPEDIERARASVPGRERVHIDVQCVELIKERVVCAGLIVHLYRTAASAERCSYSIAILSRVGEFEARADRVAPETRSS